MDEMLTIDQYHSLSYALKPGPLVTCRYKAVGEYKPSAFIRHVEPGTVSINASGNEVVFGLARSLTLDASHLVRLKCLIVYR